MSSKRIRVQYRSCVIEMIFLALCSTLVDAQQPSVVYDNGLPTHALPLGTGNNIAYFIGAEDFTLTTTQTIRAVRAWLYGNSGYAGAIAWAIYSNIGNQPGAVLASGNAAATFTATGFLWIDGTPEYEMDFPIPPFTATASTTYWLGIRNAVSSPENFPSNIPPFDWEVTSPNGTLTSFFFGYGCCGAPPGWYPLNYSGVGINLGGEHAFELLGVPSLSLLISGGNLQTGNVLGPLARPLQVTVTNPTGTPASGVVVSFAITQQPSGASGATLASATATTGPDGTASVGLTFGNSPGRYQVMASCAAGQTCTPASVTFTASAAAPPLTITTPSLPGKTAGQPYSFTLQATGGTPAAPPAAPYSWTVQANCFGFPQSLPIGLTFDPSGAITSDAAARVISDIYCIQITVSDTSGNTASDALTLAVDCGNSDRDQITDQYRVFGVYDISSNYSPFAPACSDFTDSAHSTFFSFPELHVNDPNPSALIRYPLVAQTGLIGPPFGLDSVRAIYGSALALTSGYRSPAYNATISNARQGSRHMFGDAVDFNNASGTLAQWLKIYNAAQLAGASWLESQNSKYPCRCVLTGPRAKCACVHADWRRIGGAYQP
jgi:hypothetical protein